MTGCRRAASLRRLADNSTFGAGAVFPRDVFVVGAVRTAIGSFGGALKNVPLRDLATTAVSELLRRSSLPAEKVGHVVMGNVIPTEPGDAYLGRVASLQAGIPKEVPAFNVNRLWVRPSGGYLGRASRCARRRGGCDWR